MRYLTVFLALLTPNLAYSQMCEEPVSCLITDDFTPEALALAQLCVNETSWDLTDDCAAIYQVVTRRNPQLPFVQATRVQSPRVYNRRGDREPNPRHRRRNRQWIPWLEASMKEPRGWPSGLSWDAYSPRWLARLRQAQDIVSGASSSRCRHDVLHWGNERDLRLNGWLEKIRANRWRIDSCGITYNKFLYRHVG